MYGFFDPFVILIEPVFMGSDFHSKDFLCSLNGCFFERGPFFRAAVGGHTILEIHVYHLWEIVPGRMGPSAWRHCGRPSQSWDGFCRAVQCAASVQPWLVCGQSSTQRLSWHGSHGRHWFLVGGRWWSLSSANVSTSGTSRWSCTYLPSWTRFWWCRGYALYTCWGGAGRFHWSCLLRVCQNVFPAAVVPSNPCIKVSKDD